jgi:tetratricopeptide (TPR) repeat protein
MTKSAKELIEAAKRARREGTPEEARASYEEAVAACRREGDDLRLAHTVRHLGDVHQDAGRLGPAEGCYEEALSIYRRRQDAWALDLANALRPMALLRETQGRTEEAVALWTEAESLYASLDVKAGVAECAAHLELLKHA